MNTYQQMARAFQIFAEYEGEQGVSFHHDQAYAGPDPDDVSPEHLDELLWLHWHRDDAHNCFYTFNR